MTSRRARSTSTAVLVSALTVAGLVVAVDPAQAATIDEGPRYVRFDVTEADGRPFSETTDRSRGGFDVQLSAAVPLASVTASTWGRPLGTVTDFDRTSGGRSRAELRLAVGNVDTERSTIRWQYRTVAGATGTAWTVARYAREAAPRPATPTSPGGQALPVPAPSTTPLPTAPGQTPAAAVAGGISVMDSGAVGDGRVDDTQALQRAFDAARPGTVLVLPAGRTFRHDGVLRLKNPGVTLAGGGTLLATAEATSALLVTGNGTTLDGITVALERSTRRWGAFEQMGVAVVGASDVAVRNVTVRGSAAAGVYLWGVKRFSVTGTSVTGSRADGIHVTGPSSDGTIVRPVVTASGDDGVAVVSYQADGVPVQRISIQQPQVRGTTWGRGVSVVGGTDISVHDLDVSASSAAGLYVAQEGAPWNTFAPVRVTVTGGEVRDANTSTTVDHGAVLVFAGRAGDGPRDVSVNGLRISGTRNTASRQIGLLATAGALPTRIGFTDLQVVGGPEHLFTVNAPAGSFITRGWTVQGTRVADQGGW